jgi:MATE family, multidrug efflux pump
MPKSFNFHLKNNFSLAYPVALGQIGHMMASVADSVMIGHLGSLPLAACAFANTIFAIFLFVGIGISNGITPAVGASHGKGYFNATKQLLASGLHMNLISAVILILILFGVNYLLPFMGQTTAVSSLASPYYLIIGSSLLPYLIFLAFKQFAEGLTFTKLATIVIISSNVINVFLNWLLIYGNWGMPELGLNGAGWATLISRIIMLGLIVGIFYYSKILRSYFSFSSLLRYSKKSLKYMFSLGIPLGLQFFLEVCAFSAGAIIVGWHGEVPLAAHQIAINLAAITFMMAGGAGAAASISLSILYGQKDFVNMRKSGYVNMTMTIAFMTIGAGVFIIFPEQLAGLYISEIDVIELSVKLLLIAAFFQLSDGFQVSVLGALRGMHDVRIPTIITIFGYVFLTIPLAYFLSVELDLGAEGVWYALLFGLSFAAIALYFRFEILSRKMILENTRKTQ